VKKPGNYCLQRWRSNLPRQNLVARTGTGTPVSGEGCRRSWCSQWQLRSRLRVLSPKKLVDLYLRLDDGILYKKPTSKMPRFFTSSSVGRFDERGFRQEMTWSSSVEIESVAWRSLGILFSRKANKSGQVTDEQIPSSWLPGG